MLKDADQMSRPARRYPKEIHPVDEQADPDGERLVTRSHHVIRRWAEERGALPATVAGDRARGSSRCLALPVPGCGGRHLRRVSWDDWFATFEEEGLSFIFREKKPDGSRSNYFILENRTAGTHDA